MNPARETAAASAPIVEDALPMPASFIDETFDRTYKLAYCRIAIKRAIKDLEAETDMGRLLALAGLRAALAECGETAP